MANYYSFEKGKHGGTAGYIFPFYTFLGSNIPDEQYRSLIPAGFLKCQGQVLNADLYRSLSDVIGRGSSCIYARGDVELTEPNSNGEGGQIQLPDLGSKYIVGSQSAGLYSNTETSVEGRERAGIGVEIFSASDSIEFFYNGNFRVPGRNLIVTGNVIAVSPTIKTDETFLSPRNYLPHGHTTTFSVSDRINTSCGAVRDATWRRNFICGITGRTLCTDQTNFGVGFNQVELEETGTESGATHRHYGLLPRIIQQSATADAAESLIPSGTLVTTVNIRTNEQIKMDEFAPKYILCEYLIKY